MKSIISLVLTLILCCVNVNIVRADEITDSQKQLNDVQESINDKKEKLDGVNQEKTTVEKSLGDLGEKMKNSSATLTLLNGKIFELGSQLGETEKLATQNETSLQEQNELLKKRIRAIYINGNKKYLNILLSSTSISDFVGRVDSLIRIIEFDKDLITNIEAQKKVLEIQKSEIEKKKQETTVLKQQADVKLMEIQNTTDEKNNLMTELVKDKVAYERAIQEEEDESNAITAMIILNQKRKQEAAKKLAETRMLEEKKKQEEAKKLADSKKPQSSNSNTVITVNSSTIGRLYDVTGKPAIVTSPYGWRIHPVLGTKKLHTGMDLGVWTGTSIYSLADGEVIYSGWMSGYGNVIMVDHGSLISLYAHNSSLLGKVGQKVKGGQLISYSGNTGLSSGPHLHFEIRKENGETIDPKSYYVN